MSNMVVIDWCWSRHGKPLKITHNNKKIEMSLETIYDDAYLDRPHELLQSIFDSEEITNILESVNALKHTLAKLELITTGGK